MRPKRTTIAVLQRTTPNSALQALRLVFALSLLGLFVTELSAATDLRNFRFEDLSLDDDPEISLTIPKYSPTRDEIETVAACLVTEAACQGPQGMRGVMAVIRNRSRGLPELFYPTVMKPLQFSALNKVTSGRESLYRFVRRAKADRMWPEAVALVMEAMDERWKDPTKGATHYTRSAERTRWTRSLKRTVTIADHSFYRK